MIEVHATAAHVDAVADHQLVRVRQPRQPRQVGDLRDVPGGDILVARTRDLQRRGQVGPELEPVHAAPRIAVRHVERKEQQA